MRLSFVSFVSLVLLGVCEKQGAVMRVRLCFPPGYNKHLILFKLGLAA